MLDAFKLWFMRKLGMNSQDVLPYSPYRRIETRRRRITDPRELPRPRKYPTQKIQCDSRHTRPHCYSMLCRCHNCNELQLGLTECSICLEPMYSPKLKSNIYVTSCHECGNIACGLCANKLHKCPFCRSNPGLVPNFALQKLINKLEMPCRTVSWSRMELECEGQELEFVPLHPVPMNTSPNRVLCLYKNCQWNGDLDELVQHMTDSHACTVFEGQSVSLVIYDFKHKVELSQNKPCIYILILSYLSNIFVCKITVIGTKLKFVLVSVTRGEILDFAMWIEIGCNKKQIEGVIPLSKKRAHGTFCVKNLLSAMKKKSNAVTINFMIRSLT